MREESDKLVAPPPEFFRSGEGGRGADPQNADLDRIH